MFIQTYRISLLSWFRREDAFVTQASGWKGGGNNSTTFRTAVWLSVWPTQHTDIKVTSLLLLTLHWSVRPRAVLVSFPCSAALGAHCTRALLLLLLLCRLTALPFFKNCTRFLFLNTDLSVECVKMHFVWRNYSKSCLPGSQALHKCPNFILITMMSIFIASTGLTAGFVFSVTNRNIHKSFQCRHLYSSHLNLSESLTEFHLSYL